MFYLLIKLVEAPLFSELVRFAFAPMRMRCECNEDDERALSPARDQFHAFYQH